MILNSTLRGTGEPVILIHGLFGSLSNLMMLAKPLSETYCVHMVDVRNHGSSPHHEHMDYPSMAQDLVRYMDDQEIDRAHLIGHSMGGKIAMQVAMNFSQRVRYLIVVDIAPVSYENRHDSVLEGLAAIDLNSIKSRKDAEEILSGHVNEADVRSFLLKNLAKTPTGDHRWRINLTGIERNYPNIILAPTGQTFNGPTLFVKGSESNYIEAAHKHTINRLFPRARLKVIPGTGHWLHAQKPALFIKVITSFLSEENA